MLARQHLKKNCNALSHWFPALDQSLASHRTAKELQLYDTI
jgi:hypothetical protein